MPQMLPNFCKAEIVNIMNELVRIVDRVGEFTKENKDSLAWPPYCEPTTGRSDGNSRLNISNESQ